MIISDGAIGLVSLMLAAAAFAAPLPVAPILAVAALRSVGGAFHAPCIQAITPLLAPPDALTRCAGWSQGIQTVSMLLSPALAAVLYARIPRLGASCWLPWGRLCHRRSSTGLAARPAGRSTGPAAPALAGHPRGARVLRSHRWLWELSSSVPCSQWPSCRVSALFPLMSMEYFGGDSAAAALVETLFSAGMLAGSVLLGLWGGTRNKIITMTAAVLGLGLTLVLAGLLPPSGFRAFAGLSLLMGLSAPFFNSVFMALIQTKVEPKYLGRVLGITGAIMTLASPLGLGLTALFADATGVPLWFLLAGAITLTCGGLMLLLPSVRTCGRP
ncbi:MAG: MFS transporter [Flavonifractor plautii]